MRLLVALLGSSLAAQTLVVDRAISTPSQAVRLALPDQRSYADAFRFGKEGEVWMIDRVRLWTPACGGAPLGDSFSKITLLAGVDNPPVPGQPVCDCHALVALSTAEFAKGSSAPRNPNVTANRVDGLWQLDFHDVRWSLPAAVDALFTVKATRRAGSCALSLAAAPETGHQLHLLNEKGVPIGLEEPGRMPRSIRIQVWARQVK